MPGMTINLLLELDPTSEPISGTIQLHPDGEITRFDGWLQLTQAMEAIKHSAGSPPPPSQIADAS